MNNNELTKEKLWQIVLGEMELQISRANFITWFKQANISSIEDNGETVVISVPNEFTRIWFEKKYHKKILEILQAATDNKVKRILYKIEARPFPITEKKFVTIEEIIKKRTKIAKVYDELLKEIRVLKTLEIPENARPNYYKYLVFLPKGCDPEALNELLKNKYGVRLSGYVYEAPLHRQSVFKQYVADINSYPMADDLCTRHIALPIYPQMTENEAEYVVDCLKSGLRDMGWM